MNWFGELRRRLIALLGWLRRPRQAAAAQPSLPPAPGAAPGATPAPMVVVAAASSMSPVVPAGAAAAQHRASPAPLAGEIVDAIPSVARATVVATPSASAPKPAAPTPRPAAPVVPTFDPKLGQLKVRQFFARMIAATPAGLTIDFDDWRSASVERFFMAMTSPGLTRRREAPTSGIEQVSVTNAFQGFEWD